MTQKMTPELFKTIHRELWILQKDRNRAFAVVTSNVGTASLLAANRAKNGGIMVFDFNGEMLFVPESNISNVSMIRMSPEIMADIYPANTAEKPELTQKDENSKPESKGDASPKVAKRTVAKKSKTSSK